MFVLLLCLVILTIFCVLTWIAPIIIALILSKRFVATVKIGRFGIFYLKLYDVEYNRGNITIKIDEIGINSSFINSEVKKLITLEAQNVQIQHKYSITANHVQPNSNAEQYAERKIPNFVPTFAQFMAVHIYNISAYFIHNDNFINEEIGNETNLAIKSWWLHAIATELHLDGSIVQNAQTLLVNVNVLEASVRLYEGHFGVEKERSAENARNLGEVKFAINMEATLIAQGPLSFEKLSIGAWQTGAVITDGFYSLVQQQRPSSSKAAIDRMRKFDYKDLCQWLLPMLPKNFMLRVDNTSLRGVRADGHPDFSATLTNLSASYRFYGNNKSTSEKMHSFATLVLDDLTVRNNREQLLFLKRIKLDAKVDNKIIDIYIFLNTLRIVYDHETFFSWLSTHFLRQNKLQFARVSSTTDGNSMWENVLNLTSQYALNACAECVNVSSLLKFSRMTSSLGVDLIKLILNQNLQHRNQGEVLLEALSWSLNDFNEGEMQQVQSKRRHVWGTPFYIGMCLIHFDKVRTKEATQTQNEKEMKVHAIIDGLQLEWSSTLAGYILLAGKAFQQYGQRVSHVHKPPTSRSQLINDISLNVSLHQVNCFFQSTTQHNEYLIFRFDTIKLTHQELPSTLIELEEFKFFTVRHTHYYNCLRCDDVQEYQSYVQTARVDLNIQNKQQCLHLLQRIDINWSPNLHLKLLYLLREIKEFVDLFSENFAKINVSKTSDITSEMGTLSVNINGEVSLRIKVSKNHTIKLTLEQLTCSRGNSSFSLENSALFVSVDDESEPIFNIEGISFQPIDNDPLLMAERLDCDGFFPHNRAFSLAINSFKVKFPYQHAYAEAMHDDFITVFKWLKLLHSNPNLKPTLKLPPDLLVTINEFLFEMADDPFEVKIRDNFELLVDEYNESVKRNKKLADKVQELVSKHLHLPAGKVEELYANLQAKNAQIYVQRSKQLAEAGPPRTRLFAWSITNAQIVILADESIHGSENVVKMMREIDADSPWPEEGLDFAILWCRMVSMRCEEWKFQLRDFPQPLLLIRKWYICGMLVGGEQLAPLRAKRDVTFDLGLPFPPITISRALIPLKFYHDLNSEIDSFSYAFGPCWEPAIAQCHLSFEHIFAPSKDPSPLMPFWDKMRLLLHGRLTIEVKQLTVLLHASLDPYNTTEEMELTWQQVVIDWTNGRFVFKGDFNIFVRTASKYDDCQLLHLPNLKLVIGLEWVCLGDPRDHHGVVPCAPDKVPEYSSNQVHDSFRAFRSQNLNISLAMETKPSGVATIPTLSLYGSTLRWFENLKLILQGVTRPTRRGRIFCHVRPRKLQLSRHYRKVHFLLSLHKFQVCYWMSAAMQRGCELLGGHLASTSEHYLQLLPIGDGLKHRPKAEWSIIYVTSELMDSEIWLKSALEEDDPNVEELLLRQPVEKCYCLSVAKVSYGREPIERQPKGNKDTPMHRLVVYDLKGAWTQSNRNVVFALFDTFMKNKQMKKNLSTEVLKHFRKDNSNLSTTPMKTSTSNTGDSADRSTLESSSSPLLTKLASNQAATMLQQLIAEAENKNVVFSDDLSSAQRQQQHLQGPQACQEDDVVYKNWNIALVNAQVLLKGSETKGYVILSAAKAEIVQRHHRPVWKECTLVSKTTWVGILECMQYYATVNAGENDSINENIMWLTVDNIQEKECTVISEIPQVPNMVGCGVSVGAVVSDTVGPAASDATDAPIQLQRIVSRCKCEFFYVGYGDISVDPSILDNVPQVPQDEEPFFRRESAVNAFTLMHHDLDVCTNSLQYGMLLDIINNLLLFVDTHRKEALERLARMRFQLQLGGADQRKLIQVLQTKVRASLSKLRRLEKEVYLLHKLIAEENFANLSEMTDLERDVYECKNLLNVQAEELDMMLSCYKERQLLVSNRRLGATSSVKVVRANEIFFKHARWRLTETDGQIGIADLVLSNFLYTKNSKSDDCVEHLLELGYVRMTNLLPNQIYKEVLLPTEIQSTMPVEHKRVVRIFCRERPPVGGIAVKEHFEINVVPLTIALTKKFYGTMLKFCFPERDTDLDEEVLDDASTNSSKFSNKKEKDKEKEKKKKANFYVHIDDDIEKMKQRAEKNKLFIYIKIPEVPVRLSYKGNKEKNLEDIRDFSLIIPTLEYHNVTWTWLDLLLAVRSDSRKVILSQAIKQKLQFKRNNGRDAIGGAIGGEETSLVDETASPAEEADKARMLLGRGIEGVHKGGRKGMFKFGK